MALEQRGEELRLDHRPEILALLQIVPLAEQRLELLGDRPCPLDIRADRGHQLEVGELAVEEQQPHHAPVVEVVGGDLERHHDGIAPEHVLVLVLGQASQVEVQVQVSWALARSVTSSPSSSRVIRSVLSVFEIEMKSEPGE